MFVWVTKMIMPKALVGMNRPNNTTTREFVVSPQCWKAHGREEKWWLNVKATNLVRLAGECCAVESIPGRCISAAAVI